MPVPTECNIIFMFINLIQWDHNGPHGPVVTLCTTSPVITTCTVPLPLTWKISAISPQGTFMCLVWFHDKQQLLPNQH